MSDTLKDQVKQDIEAWFNSPDDLAGNDEMAGQVTDIVMQRIQPRLDEQAAEIKRLREGEDPTPHDEAAWPTPGQWIYRFNRMTAERRLAAANRVVVNGQESLSCFQMDHRGRIEAAEQQRNTAYCERAHLVAFLASLYPAVIAYSDPAEPEWPVIYIITTAGQLSWHLSKDDLPLFPHVPVVEPDNLLAQWDRHTTEEKYRRLGVVTARCAEANTQDGVSQ